nr:hypothetical protein [Tanacetum cinerariifolium]
AHGLARAAPAAATAAAAAGAVLAFRVWGAGHCLHLARAQCAAARKVAAAGRPRPAGSGLAPE